MRCVVRLSKLLLGEALLGEMVVYRTQKADLGRALARVDLHLEALRNVLELDEARGGRPSAGAQAI